MAVVPLERAAGGALTAVFVCDPRHRDPPPAELLRERFGLSPREARLALLLARGADLQRAAAELAIRPATARTHLKRIFYKTGVHRQAALVGLLHRLLGLVQFEPSAPSAPVAGEARV
jgi:DNA-binding CsgD family transcriptional regulator